MTGSVFYIIVKNIFVFKDTTQKNYIGLRFFNPLFVQVFFSIILSGAIFK